VVTNQPVHRQTRFHAAGVSKTFFSFENESFLTFWLKKKSEAVVGLAPRNFSQFYPSKKSADSVS
jgi:hypothetical protein